MLLKGQSVKASVEARDDCSQDEPIMREHCALERERGERLRPCYSIMLSPLLEET